MNLKSMSVDRLAKLQGQVEAALVAKVADQRRALESELSKISRFQVGGARTKSGRGGLKGSDGLCEGAPVSLSALDQIHLNSTRRLNGAALVGIIGQEARRVDQLTNMSSDNELLRL
jgi:hypothetical protein